MRDIPGTLFPPGKRKSNRFYVWKGRVAGRSVEVVCRAEDQRPTADARIARRFVQRLIDTAKQHAVAAPAGPVTLTAAAQAYIEARGLSRPQRRFVEKLKIEIGHMLLSAVRQADLDRAACRLYPSAAPATKNRHVYAVGAAILHYGAENDWCEYRRIRKLKEPRPETRRPSRDTEALLLANTAGLRRLFILIIFRQGWRISETLSWREEKVDLGESKTDLWIPKAKVWKTITLHYEVAAALANRAEHERWHAEKGMRSRRPGYVFPWRQPSDIYRWLRPLCGKRGIHFTPHMARHEFASSLRERSGATARDIMDAGTWTSDRSTARYDHSSAERVRDLVNRKR
jgi:integrase